MKEKKEEKDKKRRRRRKKGRRKRVVRWKLKKFGDDGRRKSKLPLLVWS